jgi:proteasome assembly chaperone 4
MRNFWETIGSTAKRFKKQIFMSIDIPASFLSLGQGPKLLHEAEKGIVVMLAEMEEDKK